MSGCCDHDCSLDRLRERQRGTLQIVIAISAVMFFVIAAAALYGKSTSPADLLTDNLDNLGDALTYGFSPGRTPRGNLTTATIQENF